MSEAIVLLSNILVGVRNAATAKHSVRCKREAKLALDVLTSILSSQRKLIGNYIDEYASDSELNLDATSIDRALFYRSFVDAAIATECFVRSPDFLALLTKGVSQLLLLSRQQRFGLLEVEADHIHNLPYYAFDSGRESTDYYKDVERPLYRERIRNFEYMPPKEYEDLWASLGCT